MNRPLQSIALTLDVCDVNGCREVPTYTDGEYVQCVHHEPECYRSMYPWVPIVRLEYRDTWPFVVAWFSRGGAR